MLMILFSVISPIGPRMVIIPLPSQNRSIVLRMFYYLLFLIFYTVILPIGEVLYYFVFCLKNWRDLNPKLGHFIVLIGYTLMNYLSLIWIVDGFFAQIFVALVSLAVGAGIVFLRDKENLYTCLAIRSGLAIGITLWILYEGIVRNGYLYKKQPEFYFGGDSRNIFG